MSHGDFDGGGHHDVGSDHHHVQDGGHHDHHQGAQHNHDGHHEHNFHKHHGLHKHDAADLRPDRHRHHRHHSGFGVLSPPTPGEPIAHASARRTAAARKLVRVPRSSDIVVLGRAPAGGLPDRCVASVRLPADSLSHEDGITYFAVDVTPSSGEAPFRVQRRYHEFRELAMHIAQRRNQSDLSCFGAPFPKKTWMRKCTCQALEARRGALEVWLNRVVERVDLRHFLLNCRSPVPPQAFENVEPSAPALSDTGKPELEFLEVVLPSASSAGDKLRVSVPDGPEVVISILWGLARGRKLGLWFDTRAGTLGVNSKDWKVLRA
mmetsp:Transcript_151603/g.486464  ORF Transcript_151603/g.486464 Transcript_151603/m.486464 type:complete len:321 (+) Transcript_151603:164-1126(+)|eukprot:CAMPEP_0203949894 /NCGR_PEP_ID=MMETSP0359-20131031/84186_1 /ASSEMBLY_ACC=CAM_ASM_000338 /TAXON_ID=268821 /ORGANISM="Scrippsiella Hangoei, Strain SHTV-5" /LENGTH=320 /DNA_ID=CAMNT_0050881955 /DNA_START=60 /DNA_END=1022 /DNA_ORIENTATION=+